MEKIHSNLLQDLSSQYCHRAQHLHLGHQDAGSSDNYNSFIRPNPKHLFDAQFALFNLNHVLFSQTLVAVCALFWIFPFKNSTIHLSLCHTPPSYMSHSFYSIIMVQLFLDASAWVLGCCELTAKSPDGGNPARLPLRSSYSWTPVSGLRLNN